jgi:FtsP/CotA-like multicopper oxidase with cupredoxin domain
MLLTLILLALFSIAPPPSPTYTAEGRGVQIYRCTQQNTAYAWVFQSPEATLFDPATHQQIGTHFAGPTWTWKDGSAIVGKVIQTSPSTDASAIPWLILTATPTGTTTGALTPIKKVYRADTHGGTAPASGCDAQHADATIRVPYTATYYFYSAN